MGILIGHPSLCEALELVSTRDLYGIFFILANNIRFRHIANKSMVTKYFSGPEANVALHTILPLVFDV